MKNIRQLHFALLSCLVVIISCDSRTNNTKDQGQAAANSEPKYKISQPSALLDMQAETQKVSASNGGIITFSNGTSISVPANAFICEGKPVKDSVDISFEQYDDAFDIFSSGIPMQYDSAGQSYTFSSAGMCKIDGNYKGKALEFAPGKELGVSMMSKFDETDYSLYYFDTIQGQWLNKGKDVVRPLATADSSESSNPVSETDQTAEKRNPKAKSITGKDVLPVRLQDISRYPKLMLYSNIQFKLAPEELKRMDEIKEEYWYEMEIDTSDQTNGSFLTLTGNLKQIKVKGDIYLDGEIYTEAIKRYGRLKKAYDERMAAIVEVQKKMETYNKASRSFAVNGFGVWNCDRPLLATGVNALFKFEFIGENTDSITEFGIAYMEMNAIYRLPVVALQKVKILKTKHNFYATDKNGDIYLATISKNISMKLREQPSQEAIVIEMEKLEYPELFYLELKNQANEKLMAMSGTPANWQ